MFYICSLVATQCYCYTYLELLLELLFLNVKRDRLILKRPTDRQRASDGQGTATIPGGLGSHSEYWSPIIVRIEECILWERHLV